MKMTAHRVILVGFALALAGCRITIIPIDNGNDNGNNNGGTSPPITAKLGDADAEFLIIQPAGSNQAEVSAALTDSRGRAITLTGMQAIEVNGRALDGPENGQYTRSIPAANIYMITVREPTRGVETTNVPGPAAFDVTSPEDGGFASLSGFPLEWSGANGDLDVQIRITQTIFGETRSKTIGPIPDTGSRVLSANDLASFVQGANLSITLTKIASADAVAGLGSADVSIRRIESISVTPDR